MAITTCPTCGKPRDGVERFCSSCGRDYWKAAQGVAQPAPVQPAVQAGGQSSSLPLILGAVIVLALLAGGAYVYLSGVSDDIEADVANQLGGDGSTPRLTATPEPIGGSGEVTFGIGLDDELRVEEEKAT